MLWLTPIRETEEGWTLGEERIRYTESEIAPVLSVLKGIHPRLLPLVKAAILPDEPDEEEEAGACGTAADFDLSVQGDIEFDGRQWRLSHCGQSFFHMLLSEEEIRGLLVAVPQVTEEIAGHMERWLQSGMRAIVIKE
ncbi:hypothetical protein AM501_06845 [Aneurinibacillus migulanus]|uniref:hypothetical protein n=1 Tax=Aneurinibacillus migulanus TaxID=47500 RepID=UPI0005BDAEDB|nr:hypothetical protein [Aneurinibacillus migulanus]KIV50469.1 hypothetical protein TS64_28305 [Aneurinibacillus migulanus]KPD09010.1 hypothetical protein AM501_06845 [Aneurinibacillus migulanus]MCP1355737.1 hypothetical protein [Aneurinibacillus migulanus]